MKFENIRVMNFENALRGMRNPKESYNKSDSYFGLEFHDFENILMRTNDQPYQIIYSDNEIVEFASIGPNDMKLAQTLIKAGSEHRKFMRQIFVSVDITAPLYWWKEFDTYKVGTVANSTSTMHTIQKKEINFERFETDDFDGSLQMIDSINLFPRVHSFLKDLEQLRQMHVYYAERAQDKGLGIEERKECERLAKAYWKELIRWSPDGWLQTRTVTMNYENLLAMCSKGQRRFHKLTEWSGDGENFLTPSFIKFARSLPYAKELIFIDEVKDEEQEIFN